VLVADGENLRLTHVFSDPNKYNSKLYQPIRKGELFFIEVMHYNVFIKYCESQYYYNEEVK